jgi:hypothetical protein
VPHDATHVRLDGKVKRRRFEPYSVERLVHEHERRDPGENTDAERAEADTTSSAAIAPYIKATPFVATSPIRRTCSSSASIFITAAISRPVAIIAPPGNTASSRASDSSLWRS